MKDTQTYTHTIQGVNPSDTYVRLGPNGPYKGNKKLIPELPYTPGKDASGVVERVGSSVKNFKESDRVYVSGSMTGTYSNYAICNESTVYALPSNVSFFSGSMCGSTVCYGASCDSLSRKTQERRERVHTRCERCRRSRSCTVISLIRMT